MDVARGAGVGQSTISKIERGHIGTLSVDTLRRVFAVLDARYDSNVWWRAGDLDRLLDEKHAALCSLVAEVLERHGWDVHAEVTFSRYGERGSVDLLAWRASESAALVCEVKTELVSIEETLRRLDVKRRLAADIVRDTFAVRPRLVGRVLVLPERSSVRSALARHAVVLGGSLPDRGATVRAWLDRPAAPLNAIWVLSNGRTSARRGSRPDAGQRVRRSALGSGERGR